MDKGLVSGAVPLEVVKKILGAIATIRESLPFLIALSPEDRRTINKLGPKSLRFVQMVRDIVAGDLDLVPKSMDPEEFLSDAALVESMERFHGELIGLAEAVDDTRMGAGSDAMSSALQFYGVLKQGKKTVPGLDNLVRDIGIRFRRRAGGKATPVLEPAKSE